MSREATSCDLWDCSFNKYLLSTYYMPVTVLGVSDTSMNKFLQKVHDLWSIYMLAGVRNWYIIDIPTEKAMAPHSSTLAWKIPWTEEPGRLQSMGSLRVGHNWATSLSLFTLTHWRRKWQPTPVFLPGESQGRQSLGGLRLWSCTESDMTEAT